MYKQWHTSELPRPYRPFFLTQVRFSTYFKEKNNLALSLASFQRYILSACTCTVTLRHCFKMSPKHEWPAKGQAAGNNCCDILKHLLFPDSLARGDADVMRGVSWHDNYPCDLSSFSKCINVMFNLVVGVIRECYCCFKRCYFKRL